MTATQELRAPSRLRLLQTATLALLLAFVVWRSFSLKLTVRDLDNWWHLKVGDWILHNHAFPHTGIFSATAATIDGRTDLYGDELIGRFFATGGGDGYLTDPYLNQAGIVLLERELPLAALLERDPRFQKVYEDRLAVVFVRGGS